MKAYTLNLVGFFFLNNNCCNKKENFSVRRVITTEFSMEIPDKKSKGVPLTHGAWGGPQCCHGHGHHTLTCTNRVTRCILYSAHSWKSPQMLHSKKQDLASEREETFIDQTGLFCSEKL